MPSKRQTHQGIDHYAGALKSIMRNKEGYSDKTLAIMLEAAKLLAALDGIPGLPGNSGQPPSPAPAQPTVDPLLESLKARHAAQGGDNATT
jgi:hypothetical protein